MKILVPPFLGTNDDIATFNGWLIEEGSRVKLGSIVATLETTKTVFEVEAEAEGFFYPIVSSGELVKPNQPLAIISEEKIEHIEDAIAELKQDRSSLNLEGKEGAKTTKKAEILMRRHGLTKDDFVGNHGLIDEALVSSIVQEKSAKKNFIGMDDLQRVGIIGGVGGGGALIVAECLLRSTTQRPICIFDRNSEWHGEKILGVPVVGSVDKVFEMLKNDELDSVIIAFNANLEERDALFNDLTEKKVPFCNVIDSKVELRMQASIGLGNVILANAYLGACTKVGDNNFISAHVVLEHGNQLGNSCAFGPGVFTSGNVTIGDRVRFGTQIAVEPNVNIGDDVIISSGSTILQSIAPKSVIKVNHNQKVSLFE